MGKGDREIRIIQMIKDVIEQYSASLEGYQVLLFGSRASGQSREKSDFDVGILGKVPLPVDVFFAIEDALEKLPTLSKIDLVDMNQVSSEFLKLALKKAKVLYG